MCSAAKVLDFVCTLQILIVRITRLDGLWLNQIMYGISTGGDLCTQYCKNG